MPWFSRLFSNKAKKRAVWSKGFIVAGQDPDDIRMDQNHRMIRYCDFRDTSSELGWDFQFEPVQRARCAADDTSNLCPINLMDIGVGAISV